MTLLTLVSRATGLARDRALAVTFGAGAIMDAFWLAFLLPNLFRRLFGEGALSAAFLPVYSKLDRDDPAVARQLATLTVALLMTGLGGLTLLGEMGLLIISAYSDHSNLAVWLMMVMLPYMPLVCLVAILGAMLQVHGRFGPTAAAPVVLNLLIVAAALAGKLLASDEVEHVGLVAASVILAGLIQVLWALWSLRYWKWWGGISEGLMNANSSARAAMKRVLAQAWPMFLGLGVLQLNTFLDGLIASYPTTFGDTIFGYEFPLDPGSLAALSFAQRLYEFPLGVFGIAIATAIFPALSRVADDGPAFGDILRRGVRLVMFIGLPASAGLMLVREPLTGAVLQGGDFTPDDTRRVAFVLLGYAPAIWAYSMTHVLTRGFYARGDSMTPVKVAVAIVGLNLALNLTLIWTPLKEAGLAWSTAICAVVQTAILLRMTQTRFHSGRLVDQAVMMSWLRTLAVTVCMAAVVGFADRLLPATPPTWVWAIARLAVLVCTGALVALIASTAFRMPELAWALGRSPQSSR